MTKDTIIIGKLPAGKLKASKGSHLSKSLLVGIKFEKRFKPRKGDRLG